MVDPTRVHAEPRAYERLTAAQRKFMLRRAANGHTPLELVEAWSELVKEGRIMPPNVRGSTWEYVGLMALIRHNFATTYATAAEIVLALPTSYFQQPRPGWGSAVVTGGKAASDLAVGEQDWWSHVMPQMPPWVSPPRRLHQNHQRKRMMARQRTDREARTGPSLQEPGRWAQPAIIALVSAVAGFMLGWMI